MPTFRAKKQTSRRAGNCERPVRRLCCFALADRREQPPRAARVPAMRPARRGGGFVPSRRRDARWQPSRVHRLRPPPVPLRGNLRDEHEPTNRPPFFGPATPPSSRAPCCCLPTCLAGSLPEAGRRYRMKPRRGDASRPRPGTSGTVNRRSLMAELLPAAAPAYFFPSAARRSASARSAAACLLTRFPLPGPVAGPPKERGGSERHDAPARAQAGAVWNVRFSTNGRNSPHDGRKFGSFA